MSLRETEAQSIEAYVQAAANRGCFTGRVLDFGAGRQPYRKIVEAAGAEYVPFDRIDHPASVATTDVGDDNPLWTGLRTPAWNAILCTQVIQYIPGYTREREYDIRDAIDGPTELLEEFNGALFPGGYLVMTGPTNWPAVETQDLQRFTAEGITQMILRAGFASAEAHYRANIVYEGERWPIGWGAIARRGG